MNSPATRLVFMGTPEFAVPSLEILIRNRYPVPAVVTAPDKPRGRGQEFSPTPVKKLAVEAGIPVLQPEQLDDPGLVARLKEIAPDMIVVVAFRILPREIYTIPRLAAFNLHASLLPKYRGAAPINWAIINGENETGVTTFLLEDKVDTGGIVLQRSIPIGPDDNAGTIHDKLAMLGAQAVLETVRKIEEGGMDVSRQDNSLASRAPKIFKDDCRIRWNQPAERIHNFIRGLSPYPAAFTEHREKILKVYRTRVVDAPGSRMPGEVEIDGEEVTVAASEGGLCLIELQQEGRRRMTAAEFLRGYPIRSGEKLI
jgi:methionyl-tRNA formyltransferase